MGAARQTVWLPALAALIAVCLGRYFSRPVGLIHLGRSREFGVFRIGRKVRLLLKSMPTIDS